MELLHTLIRMLCIVIVLDQTVASSCECPCVCEWTVVIFNTFYNASASVFHVFSL